MESNQENKVQQTKRYDRFRFMESNRHINRGHVDRLKKSIEDNPTMLPAQPILVNHNMEIIDGQHRFTACKELGLPIYFMKVTGLTIDDARRMNVTHKGWKPEDYARSYASTGNRNYIQYLELAEEYEGFNHSILINYISGETKNGLAVAFRVGQLRIEDLDSVRARLDRLMETSQFVEQVSDGAYAIAFLHAMNAEKYNQKHMLRKLTNRGASLKRYSQVTEYMRALEDIYNSGIAAANRIRIY
jgi:hypothetical protein